MIVDDKGKLFGKINLLDLFIILILIAAVAFGGWYFMRYKNRSSDKLTVQYTVEVKAKQDDYFEHILPGEQVVDGKTKQYMGKIVSYEKKPAVIKAQDDEKKQIVSTTVPGYYDAYIVIEVEADVAYPDIKSGDVTLKIGKEAAFRSETVAMHGYIVNMEYDTDVLRRMK